MTDHKCTYYDPETSEDCRLNAVYVVSHDDGEPGAIGVLSTYRCEQHKDANDVRAFVPLVDWYHKHVLGTSEQTSEWDVL